MNNYGYVDVGKLADYANNSTVGLTANDIMRFPRADVQPVKHGRWEYREDKYGNDYICSNCKNKNDDRTWFCPYCGVDMREDCYEHRKSYITRDNRYKEK